MGVLSEKERESSVIFWVQPNLFDKFGFSAPEWRCQNRKCGWRKGYGSLVSLSNPNNKTISYSEHPHPNEAW